VDVTGVARETPKTDGTTKESQSEFKFIPANDVVKAKDIFIPGLFLKLFKYVLGIDVQSPSTDFEFGAEKPNDLES
jgi:hypothetical protein